jgi:penicillin-binding protein 4
VRILTGYILILLFIPLFFTVVTLTFSEAGKADSFDAALDKKIDLTDTKLSQTSWILSSSGSIVTEVYSPMNRSFSSSEEIPDFLKELFIISEDRNFMKHPGFDLAAIGRALAINIHADGIEQGASTITQQLARNQYLNHHQSYNRKLSEVLYAYQLEKTFSKEEILEQYLNAIYFQNNAYGIKAAADFYFEKRPADLTKAEQAFLAAIPNNPSYYDPLKFYDRTKNRQELLLDQMAEQARIPFDEGARLKKEPIVLKVKQRANFYPDYTAYVFNELHGLVAESEKITDQEKLNFRVKEVLAAGVKIHTALDENLQKKTIDAVKKHVPYQDIEGAAAVVNHQKGLIVALAGGKNYQSGDFNRSYQAFRQPGSAIKPLLVYAPYFERNRDTGPATKVDAGALCIKGYCPENYGGSTYGKVTLEKAFIHSYNTPAVRMMQQVGVDEAFRDLGPFAFKKVTGQDHVPASAVGGFTTGMSPLEMTQAYTVFSNDGRFVKPRAILKVTDSSGKLLFQWKEKPVKVWSPETAATVRELMQKTVASGTARKAALQGRTAGGKTGTTNDFKDFWFIGFSGSLTAGVWVGKDSPQSMETINSNSPQLFIWRDIMK